LCPGFETGAETFAWWEPMKNNFSFPVFLFGVNKWTNEDTLRENFQVCRNLEDTSDTHELSANSAMKILLGISDSRRISAPDAKWKFKSPTLGSNSH
jgi:hypothetical protein